MLLAVMTFMVGIGYVPGLPSNATVGRWLLVGVIAAVLLWRVRIRPSRAHWLGVAFFAWLAISSTWAISRWDHAGGALQFLWLAGVFCVAADQDDDLDRFWIALAAGVTLNVPFAMLQLAGVNLVWNITPLSGVGLFLSKNMAAEIAVLSLVGAIGIAARRGPPWALLTIGPLGLVILTGSRAGLLALVVAAWTAAFCAWRPARPALLVAPFAFAPVYVVFWLVDPALFKLADRMWIWGTVAPHVYAWGDGLGSLSIAWPTIEYAHNEMLHFAFELGIGSILLWGIVGYAFLGLGIVERAALAAFVAFCVVWFPMHSPATAMVAAVVAGRLCGERRRVVALQSDGRARLPGSDDDPEPLGDGPIRALDPRRGDLSARPQPALGA